MVKKFNLSQLMSDQSKDAVDNERMAFKVEFIPIEKLYPSEMNKYTVQDVAELKASIELMGLQQNLLVRTKEGGYEVISGHRRLKAMQELQASGDDQFKLIPCKIMRTTDDIQAELQLLLANSTARELTDYEKTYQAARLQELLQELERGGYKFTGRKREIVAQLMGVSSAQVGRMDSINKKLSPELKEEFSEGNINITTAYELSRLPEEQQQEVIAEREEGRPLTPTVVKEKRAEQKAEEIEPRAVEIMVEKHGDSAQSAFRFRLKSLVNEFGSVLEALNGVTDSVARAKYSKELSDSLKKMEETLPQPEDIRDKEFEERQVTIFDELVVRK